MIDKFQRLTVKKFELSDYNAILELGGFTRIFIGCYATSWNMGVMMLKKLLKQAQQYDIEINLSGITNHLPMALIALDKLGAHAERLNEFYETYSDKLKPLEYSALTENFKWESNLGDNEQFGAYLDFYLDQISIHGLKSTLETYTDTLIQGCAASAFHGLIRLSYGISIQNYKEVAFGLAQLSSHYIPIASSTKQNIDASEIINNALIEFSDYTPEGDTITKRLLKITQHQNFINVNYSPPQLSLRELHCLFSDLYLRTNDFTVLHTITSCHAMRLVIPYVTNRDAAIQAYWSSIIAAILSIKQLEFIEPKNCEIISIDKLDISRAVNSDNDHIIKLVHSCIDEYKYYGNNNSLKMLNTILN